MQQPSFSQPNNPRPISSIEASELFGVTNDYVSLLCRQGRVVGERIGRTWFVDACSLEAYLEVMQQKKESRSRELSKQLREEYVALQMQPLSQPQPVVQVDEPVVWQGVFAPKRPVWYQPLFNEQIDTRHSLAAIVLVPALLLFTIFAPAFAFATHQPFGTQMPVVLGVPAPSDFLTASANKATELLHTPGAYTDDFDAPPAIDTSHYVISKNDIQDTLAFASDFNGSLSQTVAVAWDKSFGLGGKVFVASVAEFGQQGSGVINNELNLAVAWDAWTTSLSRYLYPAQAQAVAIAVPVQAPAPVVTATSTKAVQIFTAPTVVTPQPVMQKTVVYQLASRQQLAGYVTESELNGKITELSNSLTKLVYDQNAQSTSSLYSTLWGAMALMSRIDTLPSTVTVNNSPIVTQATLPALQSNGGGTNNSFAYPFPSNATSTLLSFNGGLTAYASSTIGDGTQTGGLTISGNATTTGSSMISGGLNIGNPGLPPISGGIYLQRASNPFISFFSGSTQVGQLRATATTQISMTDFGGNNPYFTVNTGGSKAGNVGIGTTSPFATLSVQGNGYLSGNLTAANITATGTLSILGLSSLNGLISYASSTIGDSTQTGGLTINGGATTTGQAVFASVVSQPTANYWLDSGPVNNVGIGGRLFVGPSYRNTGDKNTLGLYQKGVASWIDGEATMGYYDTRSQGEFISGQGRIGVAGVSRSSDNVDNNSGDNASIGVASYVLNDSTSTALKSSWSFYGHATQLNANSFTTAMELETDSYQPLVNVSPYAMGYSGTTAGMWLGVGGEDAAYVAAGNTYHGYTASNVQPVSVALGVINSVGSIANNVFAKGIVIQDGALLKDANGHSTWAELADGQTLAFKYGGGASSTVGMMFSEAKGGSPNNQTHLVYAKTGFEIRGVNSNDYTQENKLLQLIAPTTSTTTDYFQLSPGVAGSNAITLSAAGGDANVNISLAPKGSGSVGIGTANPVGTLDSVSTHANGVGGIGLISRDSVNANSNPFIYSYKAGSGGAIANLGLNLYLSSPGVSGQRINSTKNGWAFSNDTRSVNDARLDLQEVSSSGVLSTFATFDTTGNVGIGTTSPSAKISIWGNDTASSTLAFNIVNSASTTVFAVFNGGNAQLSGSLTQSSDRRLKTNINNLDASTSLATIDTLTPVTYTWLDPEKGSGLQYGFIAQDVQKVFPDLVSTTSPTVLTPNGTLGINYIGLIAPLVKAVQALSATLADVQKTLAGFADVFTTKKLCVADDSGATTCITKSQLDTLLQNANQTAAPADAPAPQPQEASSTESQDTAPAPDTATSTPMTTDNTSATDATSTTAQ